MAVLACDLGGTRIKLGVVESGRVLARNVIPAYSDVGLRPQLPRLTEALSAIRDRAGVPIQGLAVFFPSLVDSKKAVVASECGKFVDAVGLDLKGWCERDLGLPLALENDARAAVIGEWQHGAGRGCESVAMVTLGTGIGTGVVIEGKVLRGTHGQAGCLGGHLVVEVDGQRCTCGGVGCAEAEASTAKLPELARQVDGFETSLLSPTRREATAEPQREDQGEASGGDEVSGAGLGRNARLDYAAVFALADRDEVARKLRDRALAVWSSLVVSLIHAYDPEVVVMGGGIMRSADVILPAIRRRVERDAWTPWGRVRVVASELGDDAALLAGEWLVQSKDSI